jgi:hypothetical protein
VINPNQSIVAGQAVRSAKAETSKGRRKEKPQQSVQLGHEYADIVKKAQQANSDNSGKMVQQARELLMKGQFDTDEAARQAAQNMVEYGI